MAGVSLLDRCDLAALRAAAARRGGRYSTLVTCLADTGALAFDPDDPTWTDRDRLLAGDVHAADAFRAALGPWGWWHAPPGQALAQAVGAANAAHLDGGAFRSWCVLGPGAAGDPLLPEAAAAGAATHAPVTAVVADGPSLVAVARLFTAAGWRADQVDARDPVALMSALDHALHPAGEPVVVLAEGTDE